MSESSKVAFAICGSRLFDGEAFHDHEAERKAVIVEGGKIRDIASMDSLDPAMLKIDAREHLLAPGFIDLQVNGGGGVLLNDAPTAEGVRSIAAAHRAFGTTAMLPTVITDDLATVKSAVAAVRAAREQGIAPSVLGVHVEGIYIDVPKRGAHPAEFIRPAENDAQVERELGWLKTADCGDVMLTVSPHKVSPSVIADLAASGITVSLGHSEASYAEATAALAAGARGFTHLYNAMSPLTHRQPGMVGAALADRDSFCGVIADGHHVDPAALKIAIAAKPRGKIVLVTDAMPTAAGGPDHFNLLGRRVEVKNDRLELPDGTLAGSNLTMDEAVRFAIDHLDVEVGEALRMASLYPAAFIRREHEFGRIAPGYRASLVLLDKALGARATWVDGQADRKPMPSKG
ncbi:MAG TPA: N-acetylglucosamine-6-phosphate deacetylase [Terriglobia bacterium]|nr:N-acetylglucosamine-6-phosphate deacetylase [Terriglobia bacterium]